MALKIALIPAKSNSRRLPGKNIRMLDGRPLLAYSVESALQSKQIDKVVVSSDSEEILSIAKSLGAIPIHRPVELCGDDVPNFKVCEHVVDSFVDQGDDIDFLTLLQPTHPFRTTDKLDEALIEFSMNSEFSSLVTVTSSHRLRGSVEKNTWYQDVPGNNERAQTKQKSYEITGHLFILRVADTIKCQSLLGNRVYAWNLPESWLDIDIDTEKDFLLAQAAKKYS